MPVQQDVLLREPGQLIELFQMDLTAIQPPAESPIILFFHPGMDNPLTPHVQLVFQGDTYDPLPIEASGFEKSSQGKLPRPKLRVANIMGLISSFITTYDDLVGAKLTRKRTFRKYLDGEPTADPTVEFTPEIWFVERKSHEDRTVVEFELSSSFDVQQVMLPRRQIITATCPWVYEGVECGYAEGGKGTQVRMFLENDASTTDPLLDVCGKRLVSCQIRFNPVPADGPVPLPYGGFPGTKRVV